MPLHRDQSIILRLKSFLFGTAIAVCCCIYASHLPDPTLLPKVAACCILLIGWSAYDLVFNKEGWTITGAIKWYSAFTSWSLLSIFWSLNSPEALYQSIKVLLAFGVFVLAFQYMRHNGPAILRTMYVVAIVLTVLEAIVLLLQWLEIQNFSGATIYRYSGLHGHKNLTASFLFLLLVFVVARWEKNGREKWTIAGLLILLILILRSKAVFLGLAMGCIVYALLKGLAGQSTRPLQISRRKFRFTLMIGMNVFFLLIMPYMLRHLAGSGLVTIEDERLLLWQKTYPMVWDHWWNGVGIGNWQVFFPAAGLDGMYRAEDLGYTFQRPHNDWLWILSETGIVGFNLLLVSIMLIIEPSLSLAVKNKDASDRRTFIAGLAGFAVISFFDFPRERMEHMVLFNFLLAMTASFNGSVYSANHYQWPRVIGILLFVASAAILFVRWNSELRAARMFSSTNDDAIIQSAKSAESFCYSLDPFSIPVEWYIGNAYGRQKNFEEAHASFLKAFLQNPFQRNVLNDLGVSYGLMGNDEYSIRYLRAALRISPRYDEPRLNLAALYVRQKNWDAADTCLRKMSHDSDRRRQYMEYVKVKKASDLSSGQADNK